MSAADEAKWLTERWHHQWMVWQLRNTSVTRTKAGRRRLRLFACGCCRLIWGHLPDPRLREVVEVAERFAEGQATRAAKAELAEAQSTAVRLGLRRGGGTFEPEAPTARENTIRALVAATAAPRPLEAAFGMTIFPLPLAGYTIDERSGEELLCDLLRCVFGNPYRPVVANPSWLAWHDGTIPRLARAIYEDRAFERTLILADALEEAGCDVAGLLAHLRGPGPHVRGCFAVDLLRDPAPGVRHRG